MCDGENGIIDTGADSNYSLQNSSELEREQEALQNSQWEEGFARRVSRGLAGRRGGHQLLIPSPCFNAPCIRQS